MILIRRNSMGLSYSIAGHVNSQRCSIKLGGKRIEVQHNIEVINRAWFDWQMKGSYIQDAFKFLSNDEREFLMTGITPEEWKEIFAEKEE